MQTVTMQIEAFEVNFKVQGHIGYFLRLEKI